MSVYPAWLAGMEITAERLREGIINHVLKAASTDRASTTTLTIDPDLQFAALANVTYWVRFYCWFAAITAGEVMTDWTVPSGVTGNRSVSGLGSGATSTAADDALMRGGVHAYTTDIAYGSRNNAANHFLVVEESIVEVGATAGTIGLNWAQAASSATATQLRSGSALFYKRIA